MAVTENKEHDKMEGTLNVLNFKTGKKIHRQRMKLVLVSGDKQ